MRRDRIIKLQLRSEYRNKWKKNRKVIKIITQFPAYKTNNKKGKECLVQNKIK